MAHGLSSGILHQFPVVVAIGYATAVAFFAVRRLRSSVRTTILVFLGIVVLGSGILLETGSVVIRYAVGGLPFIFLLHMWDLHLDPARESRLSLRAYMVFLPDYAWSVARVIDDYGMDLPFKRRALDASKYVAGLGVVTAVTVGVFTVRWAAYPFLLENVYKPLGSRRNPHLAVLAAFAVSGLLHEYLFTVMFRRITGYVTAFFLLHGLAAVMTRRFKPAGWLVLPAAVFTFAFNTLSTMLLFIPINERIPLYANAVSRWMHLW